SSAAWTQDNCPTRQTAPMAAAATNIYLRIDRSTLFHTRCRHLTATIALTRSWLPTLLPTLHVGTHDSAAPRRKHPHSRASRRGASKTGVPTQSVGTSPIATVVAGGRRGPDRIPVRWRLPAHTGRKSPCHPCRARTPPDIRSSVR